MYEIVKVVNGYEITRLIGSRRFYRVYVGERKFCYFTTLEMAVAYCETL